VAKIPGEREDSNIQTLDRAVVPEKKSKPRRKVIVSVSTLVAFSLSVFLEHSLWDFIENQKNG